MDLVQAVILVMYIPSAAPLYIIARRTRAEHAWFAWVPLLNIFLLAGLAADEGGPVLGGGIFLLVLLLIPLVGFFVIGSKWADIAEHNKQKRRWGWFVALGYLLLLVPSLIPLWVIALRTPRTGTVVAA